MTSKVRNCTTCSRDNCEFRSEVHPCKGCDNEWHWWADCIRDKKSCPCLDACTITDQYGQCVNWQQ